ncbi:protein madd-4-like [Uloborus diversus]|uniref:protein madd-4-like n=1 Tax=Uloborus diversus TaxID=327109 RepID=UPI002409C0BB|nr:protein madd-4-like [Uloborus diversus]
MCVNKQGHSLTTFLPFPIDPFGTILGIVLNHCLRYVVGDWGPCSVTCGRGLQTRTVECKILLDFSRTVATIKDHECPILRPPNVKSCYPRPCSFDLGGKDGPGRRAKGQAVGIEVTYSWKDKGFTPCSASCLGGTRESVIQCLRDHDQAVVKPSLCDITLKPDAITQTCNDMPCPPKWNVTDYGPCSKPCGGGLMRRKVQCLHEMIRGADNTLVVEANKCPPPKPQEEMFCNVFDCPYHWKTDPWSKCSKSCNGGYKTRKIHCMKEMAFGQVLEFAPSDCAKIRQPKIRKPCNAKPCPTDESAAPRGGGTYVQQHPQRRVFLKVGGTAVVFAETNLKIRCPSRNHNKTNVAWYKDDQPVEFGKRMKISLKGALRIRRVSVRDSGKYSCVSGFARADIHITVKPLPVEERTVENLRPPSTGGKGVDRTMEEKLSHENRRPGIPFVYPKPKVTQKPRTADNSAQDTFEDNRRQYHYKTNIHRNQDSHQNFGHKGKPSSTEDTIVEFSTLGRVPLYIQARQTSKPLPIPVPTEKIPIKTSLDSDELLPNRDFEKSWQKLKTKVHSTSEEKSPNQVLPPPRYGDTFKQTYDGSLLAKKKPKEVWHKNDGDLFSDQEELNVGTPHGGKGFPGNPAHSGASSTHGSSHIKNLLMNLPTLGTTRGGLSDDYDQEIADDENNDDDHHPTKMASNSFVLGRGSAENLQFDWVITDWSECSQTCGGNGFQVRAAQCLVRLNNVSRSVDGSLCEDAGLSVPTTLQSCGHEDCPHWETEPWSQCLETQCFRWQYSYERRAVLCRAPNGTDLPPRHCDEKTRPRRKRECYNSKCTAEWRVTEWSQCTAACGRPGFQSRILQCVWHGGTRPAGNACRDQQRPLVMRPCRGKPCQSSDSHCTDRSSYCSLARTLHLCRLSRYHLQCCDSCRYRGRRQPPSTDDSTL